VIPSAWQAALLALGVYRLWRIWGLDDIPGVNEIRGLVTGAYQIAPDVYGYRRPKLAKLLACSWCSGWWASLAATVCWWAEPHWTLVAFTPFAVAALVGWLGHLLNE
jgi:uncharacterized protein DUF1360